MIDLDELERLAKAATPRPWNRQPYRLGYPLAGEHSITGRDVTIAAGLSPQDAAYIASANPETVLALIARVLDAEEAAMLHHEAWE